MSSTARALFVPLRDRSSVIEVPLSSLRSADEVMNLLLTEHADLELWHRFALEFLKQGMADQFVRMLEACTSDTDPTVSSQYYSEKDAALRDDLFFSLINFRFFECVREKGNKADRARSMLASIQRGFAVNSPAMFVSRGLVNFASDLARDTAPGSNVSGANAAAMNALGQFDNALQTQKDYGPAMLGRACLLLQLQRYQEAVTAFRNVLQTYPLAPSIVHCGLGIALSKLQLFDAARAAFDRANEVDNGGCALALVASACIDLMSSNNSLVGRAVAALDTFHALCAKKDSTGVWASLSTPALLSTCYHLFWQQQYTDVQRLARRLLSGPLASANIEARAHAQFLLARCSHAQSSFDSALLLYKEAVDNQASLWPAQYGLAQCLMKRNQFAAAAGALEPLIAAHPDCQEAVRLLGVVYSMSADDWAPAASNSANPSTSAVPTTHLARLQRAKLLLSKTLQHDAGDLQAWLRLGEACAFFDTKTAYLAFKKAALLYKSKSSIPVSLWNNIGCLALRLNRSAEALTAFTHAAKISNAPVTMSSETIALKHVTLYFNLARAYEMSGQFSQAISIFEKISADHPSYVDADLRLASIHKQKGQWSEAFAKMKNVLSKNQMNVDAQAMYGLYLLESGNAEPAQKQLEHYLKLHDTHKQSSNKEQHAHKIAYLKLLLADVCLERYAVLEHAHAAAKSAATSAAHARNTKAPPPSALPPAPDSSLLLAAATHYRSVLKHDPNNVYAALGVGAVLATREQRAEARECLSIVRETGLLSAMNAADQLSDAWLNLAHVLVEQNQLPAAIKLYTKCSSQCFQNRDVQVLLFLARAQYKNQQWAECKRTIARALFLTPSSDLLWYDFAIAQSEFAFHVISEPTTRTLHDMESAVAELAQAEKHFRRLSTLPSSHVSRDKALIHARHCKENISVATSHLEHDRKRAEQALLQREAAAAARLEVERRRRAEQELVLEQQRQQKERVQEGALALQRQVAEIISRAGTKSKKSQENSTDEVAPEAVNDVSALPQLKERVGELEKQVEVQPDDQEDEQEEESSEDDLFEEEEEDAGAESETEAPSAPAVESNAGKRKLDEESDGEAEMGTTAMTTSNNNDNATSKKRRLQRMVAIETSEDIAETVTVDDTPSDVGRKRAVIDDDE